MKSAVSNIRSSSSTSTGELLASLPRDRRHNSLVVSLCRRAFAIRNYHVADHQASVFTYSRTRQVQFHRPTGGHLPQHGPAGSRVQSSLSHPSCSTCVLSCAGSQSSAGNQQTVPLINRELCKEEPSQSPANVGGFNLVQS